VRAISVPAINNGRAVWLDLTAKVFKICFQDWKAHHVVAVIVTDDGPTLGSFDTHKDIGPHDDKLTGATN
jgi:hypothetical protein